MALCTPFSASLPSFSPSSRSFVATRRVAVRPNGVRRGSVRVTSFGAIMAAKEGIFYRELLHDLGLTQNGPTQIYSDSKSCCDLAYDPVSFKKTKHILRAAEGLRDYVARDIFSIVHLPGRVNIADILTKAQAVSVFVELMRAYEAYVSAA